MSKKHVLKMSTPSSWWGHRWREAIPAGNGETGIMVYGGVKQESIMITHSELWTGYETPELPDIRYKLDEQRKFLFENKSDKASPVLQNELAEKGYNPKRGHPLPLADLNFDMAVNTGFKNYSRELDMETGLITVSWLDNGTRYTRRSFVSRENGFVFFHISSDNTAINGSVWLEPHDVMEGLSKPFKIPEAPGNVEKTADGSCLYYAAENFDGSDFGAVLKIFDGSVEAADGKLVFADCNEVYGAVGIFVNAERTAEFKRLDSKLEGLKGRFDEHLSKHKAIHSKIYNSATLDLDCSESDYELSNEELLLKAYQGEMPNVLIEKQWRFSRYLLLCATKPNGMPCHLYGLWCGEYSGMWAFNMLNVNLQMIYWPVFAGNMLELHLSVFDYYEKMMADFRENATKLFGCRGIFICAVSTPESGLIKTLAPHIINWTGGAGWISQHYYDYYLFSGDKAFLKNRALPFMAEAALFYEDFMVLGEDGFFVSAPSVSPENVPGNFLEQECLKKIQTVMNATMDFAILKELLKNLIEGSKIAGLYEDKINIWEDMLTKIPPYEINEDGAVKEWMHSFYVDNYAHRHQSHTYPLFPGTEVTPEKDGALWQAFKKAIELRETIGITSQTGWSLVYMSCNYARMREGDKALECLDYLARSCVLNNFVTLHNDWRGMGIGLEMQWAPVQVDAAIGFSAAVLEMLVFSEGDNIYILPSLPKRLKKGNVSGVLCRRGISVDINWDMTDTENIEIRLRTKEDKRINLHFPNGKKKEGLILKGQAENVYINS